MHVSGEQLTLYTGIAAILRFPLTMPDELESADIATTTGVTAATGTGGGADLSKSLQGLNIKKL